MFGMVIFRACWVFFDILIFIFIPYSLCRNSDNSNPSYNGVILNQRQKNESPISSLNSTMFQDLGFHYWNNNAGNFSSHSAYDLQLSKIKEGLSSSDSFPKFTEMLNSPSSTIEDPHVSSSSYIKDELKDLSLSEKLLLETISSGFPINGHDQFSPRQISSSHHNCSSFGSAIPSRGSFSQIYPSINISNLNQPSSPLISGSFDMNLQALDLLTSTRFSGSFPQPASLDPLDMFKDSLSFGLDSIQQSNQRPSCSPSKVRFLLPSISFSFSSSLYQQQAVSVTMAWLNGYDCILDCSFFCDYLVLYVHHVYLQLYVLEFASSLNGLANSNLSGKIIMYHLNLY